MRVPVVWVLDDKAKARKDALNEVAKVLVSQKLPPCKVLSWDPFEEKEKCADLARCTILDERETSALASCKVLSWDGQYAPPPGPLADIVILDLDLATCPTTGLERVLVVPGVAPFRRYGPFIIIWSQYLFDFDERIQAKLKDVGDRVFRTPWKSLTMLNKGLTQVMDRFADEGVLHAS